MAAHSPMVAILLMAVVILAVQVDSEHDTVWGAAGEYRPRPRPLGRPQTKSLLLRRPLDICTLPPHVGPCNAVIPRFYYDPKDEKCASFNYSGCRDFGFDGNNFQSMKDCQQKCASGKGHASNRAYMLAMRCAMSLDKHIFSSDVAGACKELPKVITCMESHMHECKGVKAAEVRARLDNYRSLNTDKCQGQGQGRPCDNNYCSDHGRCHMVGGPNVQAVPFCKCDPNFSGFHCEHYSESARRDRGFTTKRPAIKSGSCPKSSWPSVVGMSFEEAKATILQDCPNLNVIRIFSMTMEFGFSRVRVYTDADGVVVSTPVIG